MFEKSKIFAFGPNSDAEFMRMRAQMKNDNLSQTISSVHLGTDHKMKSSFPVILFCRPRNYLLKPPLCPLLSCMVVLSVLPMQSLCEPRLQCCCTDN